MATPVYHAVLFDLDGTLVDTAPDLVGTLLHLRARRQLAELPEEGLRSHATRGALGLLEAGFADVHDFDPASLREEFLSHYAANLWIRSQPFAGIEGLLERLAAAGLPLGVVTNKVERLAAPVLEHAGWTGRFGCLIAGDTLARSKPDPAPVLEACRRLGVAPAKTVFVGDDRRDVEAGQRAGTATLIASWGYLPDGDNGSNWGASAALASPDDLIEFLGLNPR